MSEITKILNWLLYKVPELPISRQDRTILIQGISTLQKRNNSSCMKEFFCQIKGQEGIEKNKFCLWGAFIY